MNLLLTRQELCQVGPISSLETLAVVPSSSSSRQHFVIGDDHGTLSCYKTKGGHARRIFKVSISAPIRHIVLGKDSRNSGKTRIFYSSKGNIVGIGKKGKEFFKMSTNLSEDVRSFYVEDASIYTAGDYIFNRFVDGKDSGYYNSSDKIGGFDVGHITSSDSYDAIMGCESRSIKIVNPETAKCVIHEYVNGSVSAVHFDREKKRIVYGTKEGVVASFRVSNPGKGSETCLVPDVTFPCSKTRSPVNVIET